MTRKEALAEARKRWGADAFVRSPKDAGSMGFYSVGSGLQDDRYGMGDSYSAAFADADRRAAVS